MKERAVIYARFSSHSQTEQSIEGQLRVCHEYAQAHDIIVVGEYIDRAMTGTSDKRPDFLRMIEESRRKEFEYVIVYQLDRFARNRYDSAIYKARLKKSGVRVLSAKENITEDASGILVEGLLESMAEYYSAELSQKVKRGKRESMLKGQFIGGTIPYGYKIVDKKWVVNEDEAEIIREIFYRYSQGERLYLVADSLNNRGFRTRAGREWTCNKLQKMIRQEKYAGFMHHEGKVYEDIVPAIVDKAVYDKCIKRIDNHAHNTNYYEGREPYLLTGKLYCGRCGARMVAEAGTSHTHKAYQYYSCTNRRKKICRKDNIRKHEFEKLVFQKTAEYVLQPKTINKLCRIVVDKINSEITKSPMLARLEYRYNENLKALNNIMKALENGISTETTKDRLMKLEAENRDLEERIAIERTHQVVPLKFEEVQEFLMKFASKKFDNTAAKHEFFNAFINRVILYDDRVYIFYNTTPLVQVDMDLEDKMFNFTEALSEVNEKADRFGFKRTADGGEAGI